MILVVLDTCELWILVDDRISKQGYSLDREHVEHFLVQRRNAVVRRLDLLQVRQLLENPRANSDFACQSGVGGIRRLDRMHHAAILVSDQLQNGTILHAYSGHAVCETRLTDAWARRIAGVFRFPAAI